MSDPPQEATTPLPAEPVAEPSTLATTSVPPTESSGEGASAPKGFAVGPGTVLRERYVLERELGRGGMGTVYRALDRNKLGLPTHQRHVAVKILRDEFASRPEALHALRHEAHQAQSLSHPGIVNVFDFDRDGDLHFITMELLEGELLSDLIQRTGPGGMARDQAIGILRDLGAAVAHAHARGVLHMDLKPGNVMITTQGDVRVLDFGLAHPHMREPWISDRARAFRAATPTYASCEQLDGLAPHVRDDVFSFACMAYELLSGEHPFGRRSAREAREQGRRARRIRGLTRGQWRALQRGLAWTRAERPGSLAELLEGLELEALRLAPPRRGPGSLRQRRPASQWWLTAAGVGILAIGVYAFWNRFASDGVPGRLPEPRAEDVAVTSPRPELPAAAASADFAVAREAIVPMDVATALALTPVPAPRIVAAGPGRLEFEAGSLTVSESANVARLRLVRRGGAEGTVSFSWRAVDDSARAGQDYAALGTMRESMGPGQASTTLLVPIVADDVPESTELFDVVIGEPGAGATLGAITEVTVIIVDDD